MSDQMRQQTQDENYRFEESYKEPASAQITDDWDTVMDDYYDEYEDFNDVDIPNVDDDI